ncbi:hypothetical protein ACLOJK_040494 [Asimina triloba]
MPERFQWSEMILVAATKAKGGVGHRLLAGLKLPVTGIRNGQGRGGIRQEEEIDREDAASDFFLRMKAGADLPPVSDERLVMGRKEQRKPGRRRRRSKGRERNYGIEPRREGRVPEGRATRQSDAEKGNGRCGRQPADDLPVREEKLDNLRRREGDAGWMPIGHGRREKCNRLALLGWKTCFRSKRWKGRERHKESRQRGKQGKGETLGEKKQHARGTREARRFLRSDLAGLPSLLFYQIQINTGGKRDSKLRPTSLSETRLHRKGVLPEVAASRDGTSLRDSHYGVVEADFRSQPFEDNRANRTVARRGRENFKSATVRMESAPI